MLAAEIQNRIRQLNPWIVYPDKADTFISRLLPPVYVDRSMERTTVSDQRAILIVGCRQSGKSTMIWHRIRRFAPNILFLNMEDPLLRSGLTAPVELAELMRETYPFVEVLFIDEIQHMEEAGLFVKGLIDSRMGIPVWVGGSSSYDLRSRTRESLSGRAIRKRLLPFSATELLDHATPSNPVEKRHLHERIVSRQLVFGSYPAVYLAEDQTERIMLLSDLAEALILRDASDLFKIKRVDAFRKLLSLLAGQIGNLLNLSELASVCNVDVGTVSSYIEILEESHIVKKTLPFAEGKRREITGTPKVYFIDNGIRNQLLNAFSTQIEIRPDKGQLFENWAFGEITKALGIQDSLKFWRSKSGAEVDFVIEHGGGIFPVEVKFASLKKPEISRSMRSFIDAYRPEEFVLLNMALEETVDVGRTRLRFTTPFGLQAWLNRIMQT